MQSLYRPERSEVAGWLILPDTMILVDEIFMDFVSEHEGAAAEQ